MVIKILVDLPKTQTTNNTTIITTLKRQTVLLAFGKIELVVVKVKVMQAIKGVVEDPLPEAKMVIKGAVGELGLEITRQDVEEVIERTTTTLGSRGQVEVVDMESMNEKRCFQLVWKGWLQVEIMRQVVDNRCNHMTKIEEIMGRVRVRVVIRTRKDTGARTNKIKTAILEIERQEQII